MADYAGKQSVAGNTVKGAATGATAGAVAGPVGAAIGGVIGGAIGGIGTAIHNKKMKKLDQQRQQAEAARPVYQIPQEQLENKSMYETMAGSTRLPGQAQIENNIDANTANSVNAAMQTGSGVNGILATLSGVNQNANDAKNQLGIEGAQFQNMAKDKLAAQNNILSEYRDQAFDYNKNQPYEYNLKKIQSLQGAAIQNFNQSKQDWMNLAGMGSSALGGIGGGGGNNGGGGSYAGNGFPNAWGGNGNSYDYSKYGQGTYKNMGVK